MCCGAEAVALVRWNCGCYRPLLGVAHHTPDGKGRDFGHSYSPRQAPPSRCAIRPSTDNTRDKRFAADCWIDDTSGINEWMVAEINRLLSLQSTFYLYHPQNPGDGNFC